MLLVSLCAGALIMEFFGISIPALRIAGGLIVARIGFGMLNPERDQDVSESQREEALVAFSSWLVLRSARQIVVLLGPTGVVALTRVMGFLLVCVGVQFIGAGVA